MSIELLDGWSAVVTLTIGDEFNIIIGGDESSATVLVIFLM